MKPFTILNKALTFTLTAAVLTFTACKKDHNNKPDQSMNRLTRFEESADTYSTFDYNNAGQINRMVTVDEGAAETFNITYGPNGKPALAASGGQSMRFNYTPDNLLERADIYAGVNTNVKTGEIKLNYISGKAIEAIMSVAIDDAGALQPLNRFAYQYYPNGDVKSKTAYFMNPLGNGYLEGETVVYEYDDRKNPFNTLTELYQASFEMPALHNPVKETSFDEDHNQTSVITYTYTYNNAGYPTQAEKKTIATGQTNAIVKHLKYSYK